MKIYKYPLKVTDIQTISMPKGAEVLSVQVQHNQVCIWALVDSDERMVEKTILIVGTGNPIDDEINMDNYFFLGTVQQFEGAVVWHIFVGV